RSGAGARAGRPTGRREARCTRRAAAHVAGEDFGYRWRHPGARTGDLGRRGRNAQPGFRARLRARQGPARGSRNRTGPRIAGRLPGAESGCAGLRHTPSRPKRPMIRHHAGCAAALLLTAGALALLGCAAVADATRYYVLSSPAAPGDSAPTAVSSAGVGIGPVLVPSYLNRAQIGTRGANG